MVSNSFKSQRSRPSLKTALRFWAGFVALSTALGASFSAKLEQDSVAAGESTVLDLVFTDCGRLDPPELPPIAGCETQYAGSGTQFSIVNGAQTSSVIYKYELRPTSPGDVAIPSFSISVGGQTLSSEPLLLRVGKGFDSSALGTVSLWTPRTNLWVGETFPVEIRFRFREAPARPEVPSLKLDGFVKGRQTAEAGQPEKVNGQTYSVVRWRMAVTAVKAGELSLGPAELETVYVFQQKRRGRSIFEGPMGDPFFDRFFNTGEPRQIKFASEPLGISVKAPPVAGRPPGYNGNVGRFSAAATFSTNRVSVGDPITVRLRVEGRGDFDQLRLPDSKSPGWVTYPGSSTFDARDGLGLEGIKTFEIVVSPEDPTITRLQLPPISWWNPDTARYETVEIPAAAVTVTPLKVAINVPGNLTPNGQPQPASQELGRPKTKLGRLQPVKPAWIDRPWFAVALFFPPVAAGLALAWSLRPRAPHDHTATRRQLAEAEATAAANRISAAAAAGDSKEFFEALNDALQRRLALALGGTPGAYTEEVIESRLAPLGLDTAERTRLKALFDAISRARFDQSPGAAELGRLGSEALAALQRLCRL